MIAYMESLLPSTDYRPPLEMIWQYRLQLFGCDIEPGIGVKYENPPIQPVEPEWIQFGTPYRPRHCVMQIMLGV